jgi:DNA-binding transcriptional ArsR family regulator
MSQRKRNAYAAPAWAAEQRFGKNGGVGLHVTLLTLANYADEDFSCYPSNGRVAEETEQDERTVRRQIEILREVGLVKSERRHTDAGYRTSDRHYLQLDVVVTPEIVDAARQRIARRNEERKAARTAVRDASTTARDATQDDLTDTMSEPLTDTVSARAYRTPDTVLTDTVSVGPNGHQMSEQELLVELPDRTPRTKTARETATGTRLDPEWIPPVELRQWALADCPGVDLKLEHATFVDYWVGVPGARGRKTSWERTWRNWIRKAFKDLQRAQQRPPGRASGRSTTDDRVRGWLEAGEAVEAAFQATNRPTPPQAPTLALPGPQWAPEPLEDAVGAW